MKGKNYFGALHKDKSLKEKVEREKIWCIAQIVKRLKVKVEKENNYQIFGALLATRKGRTWRE